MIRNSNFLEKWLEIIKHGSINNTYKMAWARAITEISLEIELDDRQIYEITLHEISKNFLKYYWNQTIFFNLRQGPNVNKPTVVLQLAKQLFNTYQNVFNTKIPIRFERIDFENDLIQKSYEKILKKIKSQLKKDVSWRFLVLNGQIEGIYDYKKGDDQIFMTKENIKTLKQNNELIFETINCRWAQILEKFNFSPRIYKKVMILDREIERGKLKKFKVYLDLVNPKRICFICNQKIQNDDLSIDHVIPWSFMYSDDVWNLVYVHRSCNSSKSNQPPGEHDIEKLEKRNVELLQICKTKGYEDNIEADLDFAIDHDSLRKFWISFK